MDYWILLWSFTFSIGINLIFFIIAFIIKTDIFTDITYALSFIVLSLFVFIWKQNFSVIQISLFIAYNIWAIRIGSYLLFRILKTKVDHRFDNMRNNFWRFGSFWILQGLSVFIIAIPTIFCLSINQNYFNTNFSAYGVIFVVLALVCLGIETIADWQKFSFYNQKTNKKTFINYGLWKYSRHPNYFGEIGFWYFMTIAFLFAYLGSNHSRTEDWLQLLWLFSPIYINLLIVFVSGVPLLEIRANEKLKNNQSYQAYVNKTSSVFFFIGKKGHIYAVIKKEKNSN